MKSANLYVTLLATGKHMGVLWVKLDLLHNIVFIIAHMDIKFFHQTPALFIAPEQNYAIIGC